MSDTILMECKLCGNEGDCIEGICSECAATMKEGIAEFELARATKILGFNRSLEIINECTDLPTIEDLKDGNNSIGKDKLCH